MPAYADVFTKTISKSFTPLSYAAKFSITELHNKPVYPVEVALLGFRMYSNLATNPDAEQFNQVVYRR
jgi:hypothetical protein